MDRKRNDESPELAEKYSDKELLKKEKRKGVLKSPKNPDREIQK